MPRSPNTSPQTRAVLAALLSGHPTPVHGYDLSKSTGLRSGTLYPILRRLHKGGMLDARWEESATPGKPPRHRYSLTPEGLEAARERSGGPVPALTGALI